MLKLLFYGLLFFLFVTEVVKGQRSKPPPRIDVSQVSWHTLDEELIPFSNGVLELTAEHFGSINSEDKTYFVYISCHSSEPIEWIIDGPVYNSVHDFDEYYDRTDHWENDPSGDTEIFRSRLAVIDPVPENTETYTCRHLRDTSLSASIHIFMNTEPKPIFFRPGVTHLLTTYPYNRNTTIFYIETENENSLVLLPFHSNQANADLLKIYANKTLEIPNAAWFYNSREGLYLNLGQIDNPFATTFDVHATKDDDFMFNFHLRKNFTVRPNVTRINQPEQDPITFRCFAQEPIEFYFDPTPNPEEEGEEKIIPCAANVECHDIRTPNAWPYRSTLTCRRVNASEMTTSMSTLHTWMFTSEEPPVATITLNETDSSVKCCTKDHYKPLLQIYSDCYTFSECNLRRIELERFDYTYSSDHEIEKKYDAEEACDEKIIPWGYTHETVTVACSVGPEAFIFAQYSRSDHKIVDVIATENYPGSLRALLLGDDGSYYETSEIITGNVNDVIEVACVSDRFYFGKPKLYVDYCDRESKQIFVPCRDHFNYGLNWHFCAGDVQLSDEKIIGISCRAGKLNSKEKWNFETLKVSVSSAVSRHIISGATIVAFLIFAFITSKFFN